MKIKSERYEDFVKIPSRKFNELLEVINDCFENIYKDDMEILMYYQGLETILYLDEKNKIIGFVCYKRLEDNILEISYLGVNQDKKYTQKGIATQMVKELIKKYNDCDIILACKVINEKGKYLYNKLGFDTFDIVDHKDNGKMYYMIYSANKRYRDTASIVYEMYKESRASNLPLQDTLFRMFTNKYYDNIYQYNISEKEIDNIILKSKLFPRCLSVLEEAQALNNKKNIIEFVIDELDDCLAGEKSKITLLDILDNKDISELLRVYKIIKIKQVDEKLSKDNRI